MSGIKCGKGKAHICLEAWKEAVLLNDAAAARSSVGTAPCAACRHPSEAWTRDVAPDTTDGWPD